MRCNGLGVWALLAAFACVSAVADDWRNWRGPHGNGTADGTGYSTDWSDAVRWRVKLPGPGASTPAVVGDAIYLTAEDDGENALLCYDRDGAERWRLHVGTADEAKHRKATPCNSSPVTDGTHVVAYFKSGDLACFDLSGEQRWHKNLQTEFGEDSLWWDLGTSPIIEDGMVIVTCQQTGPSYLVAFDVATGEQRWKQPRMLPAPDEANQSYTTPCVARVGQRKLLIIVGADHITAHDLKDGTEVWRVGDLNPDQNSYFRSISSPVVAGDLVVAPYARGETLTAVRLDGTGDVTDTHVAWQTEGTSADVPTPAFATGKLYVCHDKGEVFCIDAATGGTVWSVELPRSRNAFSSSPIFADGRVYVVREDGVAFVLDASNGEQLATNEIDGLVVATPALVEGQIFLRTSEELICIGT